MTERYIGRPGREPWKDFNATEEQWKDWKWQASNSVTDVDQLADHIRLSEKQAGMIRNTIRDGKPMRITPYYISLMGENPTGVGPDGKDFSGRVNPVF